MKLNQSNVILIIDDMLYQKLHTTFQSCMVTFNDRNALERTLDINR